jgi:hypothetical protein
MIESIKTDEYEACLDNTIELIDKVKTLSTSTWLKMCRDNFFACADLTDDNNIPIMQGRETFGDEISVIAHGKEFLNELLEIGKLAQESYDELDVLLAAYKKGAYNNAQAITARINDAEAKRYGRSEINNDDG